MIGRNRIHGTEPDGAMTTEPLPKAKNGIDRSKTYVCRFGCGYETNWPAARGRHESARHGDHPAAPAAVRAIRAKRDPSAPGKPRPLSAPARLERLLEEVRKQHGEMLDALKKASLLVLAERDLRARESGQIRADLNAIYEVLERNRQAREQRIGHLVR
jgi:hypothetical protein